MFLTRDPRLYSMRRFQAACREAGHTMRILDVLQAHLVLRSREPEVWTEGAAITRDQLDALVPRIGTSVTEQGCAVVNQFEMMGIPCVNGSESILRARDKLRSLQHLSRCNVDMPATVLIRTTDELEDALDQVGGIPCVLKLLKGTQGIGVMLAESREGLESMLQAFWSLGHTVLLQEFIAESRGRDVRAFVVGDKVVGAMRRRAKLGEFRSNIHRGGVGEPVELDKDQERTVVEAAQALGLEVAGVDYLESREGPKIIEVNASPGFEGLETATGLDIAGHVVRHSAKIAKEARA